MNRHCWFVISNVLVKFSMARAICLAIGFFCLITMLSCNVSRKIDKTEHKESLKIGSADTLNIYRDIVERINRKISIDSLFRNSIIVIEEYDTEHENAPLARKTTMNISEGHIAEIREVKNERSDTLSVTRTETKSEEINIANTEEHKTSKHNSRALSLFGIMFIVGFIIGYISTRYKNVIIKVIKRIL